MRNTGLFSVIFSVKCIVGHVSRHSITYRHHAAPLVLFFLLFVFFKSHAWANRMRFLLFDIGLFIFHSFPHPSRNDSPLIVDRLPKDYIHPTTCIGVPVMSLTLALRFGGHVCHPFCPPSLSSEPSLLLPHATSKPDASPLHFFFFFSSYSS